MKRFINRCCEVLVKRQNNNYNCIIMDFVVFGLFIILLLFCDEVHIKKITSKMSKIGGLYVHAHVRVRVLELGVRTTTIHS